MKQATTRSAAERILDWAIELTFPASDPIAVEIAFRSARKRDDAMPEMDSVRRQAARAKPARQKSGRR